MVLENDRCARCDGVRLSPGRYSGLCASCMPRRFELEGMPDHLVVSQALADDPAHCQECGGLDGHLESCSHADGRGARGWAKP